MKFEVRWSPLRKIWRIFSLSINGLPVTLTFDLSTSKLGHGSLVTSDKVQIDRKDNTGHPCHRLPFC